MNVDATKRPRAASARYTFDEFVIYSTGDAAEIGAYRMYFRRDYIDGIFITTILRKRARNSLNAEYISGTST